MKKRVLLVIDQINTGGAEKIMLEYAAYLRNNGYETDIFSLYGDGEYNCGYRYNSSNILGKTFQQFVLLNRLKQYEARFSPDVIFSFLERSNILVALLPTKAKKIATVHNVISIQYKKLPTVIAKAVKTLIHLCYQKLPVIVAVSRQVKQDLVEAFNIDDKRVCVIANRVDRQRVTEMSTEKITETEWDDDAHYVINIGRFCEQKAQWRVLKSIKILRELHPETNIKGIIMGEGPLEAELKNLKRHLGLDGTVEILPYQDNPFKFLKRSAIFVLPSLYEGCPVILSEVVALRLPFVGSRTAIPIEYFSGKSNVWNDVTLNYPYLDNECGLNTSANDNEFAEKIYKELSLKSSVAATEKWNMANEKNCQYEEYTSLFR